MKRVCLLLLLWACALCALAQVSVKGTVVERGTNEALPGASVIVKGADGKIKKVLNFKKRREFRYADTCH